MLHSGWFRGGGQGAPSLVEPTPLLGPFLGLLFRFLLFWEAKWGGWRGKKLFLAPNRATKSRCGGQKSDVFPMREPKWSCGGQNPPFLGFGSPPCKILGLPVYSAGSTFLPYWCSRYTCLCEENPTVSTFSQLTTSTSVGIDGIFFIYLKWFSLFNL